MCFVATSTAQTWKPLGADENDQPSISDTFNNSMAIGPDGTPYIAYTDESIGGACTVKKFNGTTWEIVGNAGIYNNYTGDVSLAVAPDGTLYVSFITTKIGTFTQGLRVYKFNGSAWIDISPFDGIRLEAYSSIKVGPDGILYMVCSASAGPNTPSAAVYKFTGGSWLSLIPPGSTISASTANYIKLSIAADGTLYTAYADAAKANKVTVKKYSNNTWTSVGPDGFSSIANAELSLALATDGTPYVAYADAGKSNKLSVYKYDGISAWNIVGTAGFTTGAVSGVRIKIATDGTPMVMANDSAVNNQVIGKMFKNGGWGDIGVGSVSTGVSSFAKTGSNYTNDFAISPADGTPYIMYQDSIMLYKAVDKKLSGGKWVYVGPGITPDAIGNFNIKLDVNDVPYIAYTDASDSFKAYVKKYVSGSWQTVGTSFSQAKTYSLGMTTDVAIAPNGTPYVVYIDQFNGNNAVLAKSFNGTTWVPLGANGLVSATGFSNCKIYIAPDGTPYVVYSDGGSMESVKKYTGGAWVAVGNTSFSGANKNVQLTFATDGTMYVICEKGANYNNYSGYVFKLVNNVWQDMKVPNVPNSSTLSFSLALAPDNTPYVSYFDASQGSPVTLQKYDGVNWSTVSQNNTPAHNAAISNMVISPDGSITMTFDSVDIVGYSSTYNHHVMRLKNGTWTNIGKGKMIPYYAGSAVLVLPKTGEVMLAYQSGQVYVSQPSNDVPVPALAPTITSFSPAVAGRGDTVVIRGTNFHTLASYSGVKDLSFGGQSIGGYLVNSDKQITVVLDYANSGNIAVTTFNGVAVAQGFTYAPTPDITFTTLPTINSGDSIIFRASTSATAGYQWYLNGKAIAGATSKTYVAYNQGLYTLSLTTAGLTKFAPSGQYLTVNFTPPVQNYNIAITGASCKGSTNGSVTVQLSTNGVSTYFATITVNGTNTIKALFYGVPVTFNNLAAGAYTICFTNSSIPGYQQCQTVVITEPKDIAAYTVGIGSDNKTVTLKMTGGSIYNIQLNGNLYTTTDSTITLPVIPGSNHIIITSDKPCQGVIDKKVNISEDVVLYPEPFERILNVSIGNQTVLPVSVEVFSTSGLSVYKNQFVNATGAIQLDLSGIKPSGVYILKLTIGNSQKAFKIIKK